VRVAIWERFQVGCLLLADGLGYIRNRLLLCLAIREDGVDIPLEWRRRNWFGEGGGG
jgi:hypothetical protein